MLQSTLKVPTLLGTLLLAAAGCAGSDITAPEPAVVAPASSPRFSAGDVGFVNEQVAPFTITFPNSCNGEVVPLAGKVHFVMNPTTSASGGIFYQVHFNFRGRGTGSFGNEYVGQNERQEIINAPSEGTFTSTIEETVILNAIRPNGDALPDDYRLHTLIHITFTNGKFTAFRPATPTIEYKCR
jgi:hypothetical protein